MLDSPLPAAAALIRQALPTDGLWVSDIPGVTLARFSQRSPLQHTLIAPSVCFVLQGQKQKQLGPNTLIYGPGSYFVAAIDLALAGQIAEASSQAPYLGMTLELDLSELAELALNAGLVLRQKEARVLGAYVGPCGPELQDALLRLLKLLGHPQDQQILAPLIRREILYRLLTAAEGQNLLQHAFSQSHGLGIGPALAWIKAHFDQPLSVAQLAEDCHLSISAFHRHFKNATGLGPLQYQKQLRLQTARRLLLTGTWDAAGVAYHLGYASASQFSREYRRQFGASPLQDREGWEHRA
ncbi:MAG: AraC family transcriptional regulator N-terminal domain-containing protein [Candidatus Sericytochromatia bacterium]